MIIPMSGPEFLEDVETFSEDIMVNGDVLETDLVENDVAENEVVKEADEAENDVMDDDVLKDGVVEKDTVKCGERVDKFGSSELPVIILWELDISVTSSSFEVIIVVKLVKFDVSH